jgi:CDP-diacylglycerol--glycerol-3-phosphate 3-phosphatidyltransferase
LGGAGDAARTGSAVMRGDGAMTAANILTLGRLLAAPVFVLLLIRETRDSLWIASAIFVLATLTDAFDGYLARRTRTTTPVGRWLDPIADKILISGAYLAFLSLGVPAVKAWMVIVIVGRELLVSALRSLAKRRGVIIHSSQVAKWKTGFQMGVALAILLFMSLRARESASPEYWTRPGGETFSTALNVALLITIALTVLSGWDYLWKNRAVLRSTSSRGASL